MNTTPPSVPYTLSLHDALPIYAYAHADDAGQKLLLQKLGDPGLDDTGISELQQVIIESGVAERSEEHTSELQSHSDLVCRLLPEKKNTRNEADGRPHRHLHRTR